MAAAWLVAKGRRGHVENRRDVLGGEILAQLVQHVDEDVSCAGWNARLGRHGPLPRHGVIGAEDEGHGVDQKDAALGALRMLGGNRFCRLSRRDAFEDVFFGGKQGNSSRNQPGAKLLNSLRTGAGQKCLTGEYRSYLIMNQEGKTAGPLGLKPTSLVALDGTAEAVPLQRPLMK